MDRECLEFFILEFFIFLPQKFLVGGTTEGIFQRSESSVLSSGMLSASHVARERTFEQRSSEGPKASFFPAISLTCVIVGRSHDVYTKSLEFSEEIPP